MTIKRSHVAGLLPIMIAYGEGKVIELNLGTEDKPRWVVQDVLSFTAAPENYRIRPVPQVLYVITNRCGNRSLITDDKAAAENKLSAMNSHGLYKPYTLKSFTENL